MNTAVAPSPVAPRVIVRQRGVAGPNAWVAAVYLYERTERRSGYKPQTTAHGASSEEALANLRALDDLAIIATPEIAPLPSPGHTAIPFQYDDGGRHAAGFAGHTDDCVVRAIAIASGQDYSTVYDDLHQRALNDRTLMRKLERLYGSNARSHASPRSGVNRRVYDAHLLTLGWEWTPTMQIGAGTTVHLAADELPDGPLVVRVSKHMAAVIDGVLHDTHDCSRQGTRAVYGYWRPPHDRTHGVPPPPAPLPHSGRNRVSKINVTSETPTNTDAYEATLYFDDGDWPNANVEGLGYWTTADEAVAAMRAALAGKPDDAPGKDDNTARWSGVVQHGRFERASDAEWFEEPTFERYENEDYTALTYRSDLAGTA